MDQTQRYPFSDLSPADLRRLVNAARAERAAFIQRVFRALFHSRAKRQSTPIECREPHPLLLVSNA
jgi:hypothetical protein